MEESFNIPLPEAREEEALRERFEQNPKFLLREKVE